MADIDDIMKKLIEINSKTSSVLISNKTSAALKKIKQARDLIDSAALTLEWAERAQQTHNQRW